MYNALAFLANSRLLTCFFLTLIAVAKYRKGRFQAILQSKCKIYLLLLLIQVLLFHMETRIALQIF